MSQPLLFPDAVLDDRDEGIWLLCPTCGCIAELDDWDVLGAVGAGTLCCNHCYDEVTPLQVIEWRHA